jgi:hypothetical protein
MDTLSRLSSTYGRLGRLLVVEDARSSLAMAAEAEVDDGKAARLQLASCSFVTASARSLHKRVGDRSCMDSHAWIVMHEACWLGVVDKLRAQSL